MVNTFVLIYLLLFVFLTGYVPVPLHSAKLLGLLPGETSAPGTQTGRTGTPIVQTAGQPFTVTVYSCDDTWNLVNDTPTVTLTSTDPYTTGISTQVLVNGTTTFTLIYTTATTTHNFVVIALQPGTSSYSNSVSTTFTVNPSSPVQLVFSTPARRLVAGTTITYSPGVTDTYHTIQVRDIYNNVTKAVYNTTLRLINSSPEGKFSADKNNWTSVTALIEAGKSETRFYYQDKIASTPTITIVDDPVKDGTGLLILQDLTDTQQVQTITPNVAQYFTIEHNYKNTGLSVRTPGVIKVSAKDPYGNVAAGDTINGQYYTGRAVFWTSSSSVAVAPAVHTFLPTESGMFTYQITTAFQDELICGATDYDYPLINGATGRTTQSSSPHIVTVGLIVRPYDIAPEPNNPFKRDQKIAEYLVQGDGNIEENPSPVPMLRLNISIKPDTLAGANRATLLKLRVYKTGTISYDQITEVALYKDRAGEGSFDSQEIAAERADIFITKGVFNNQGWCDLEFPPQVITSTEQKYFITVRVVLNATQGDTLGIKIADSGGFIMSPNPSDTTIQTAENNFPVQSYNSQIVKFLPTMFVGYENIAPWYAAFNPETGGVKELHKVLSGQVPQGEPNVGMLKLFFWTNQFTVTLDKISVTHTIDTDTEVRGTDADIVGVQLCADMDGNRTYQPANDLPVSPITPFVNNTALIEVNKQVITQTTAYYFLTYKFADSAGIGSKHGLRIGTQHFFRLVDGYVSNKQLIYPIDTDKAEIKPTKDELIFEPDFEAISAINQGDKDVPVARFSLRVNQHTAIWNNLRIDRKGGGGDADVYAVKVYYDTPPTTQLTQYISSTYTVIPVNDTTSFPEQGYLYIDSEKMWYISKTGTSFIVPISSRGVVADYKTDHYASAYVYGDTDNRLDPKKDEIVSPTFQRMVFVSSTVEIPILGSRGGQEITEKKKTFFVAYDIDYLAKVGNTNLGLMIGNTGYFNVYYPDLVQDKNMPAEQQITAVKEYGDIVTVTALNTSTAAPANRLVQGSVNNPIVSFSVETDFADALWSGLIVTATGTAKPGDVKRVSIWRDIDNPGFLDLDKDILIATATFSNAGVKNQSYIMFNTDKIQKIETRDRSLKRYFVCYDISDLAEPEQTLSAMFARPEHFFVSAPNKVSTDVKKIPFVAVDRDIIPSPRKVTVQSEPMNATKLVADINETITMVPVLSTTGFPEVSALVIDSEIIKYYGKTETSFVNCIRGANGTFPRAHRQDAVVSGQANQGERNVPIMKLILTADAFTVKLYKLKLDRYGAPGVLSTDDDIKRVVIWRDDGNGKLDRDLVTGEVKVDLFLGEGRFGKQGGFISGQTVVNLDDPTYPADWDGNQYAVIRSTPTIFYVTLDISGTAKNVGSVGVKIDTNDYLDIEYMYGHKVLSANLPAIGSTPAIISTVDRLQVVREDILPVEVMQGAENVGVLRLNLSASSNSVVWTGLRVDRTGTTLDNDIVRVNIFKDLNNNKKFDTSSSVPEGTLAADLDVNAVELMVKTTDVGFPVEGYLLVDDEIVQYKSYTSLSGNVLKFVELQRGRQNTIIANHFTDAKVYGITSDILFNRSGKRIGRLTTGKDLFANGYMIMNLAVPETIRTLTETDELGQNYFIVYDINPYATVGKTFGVSIATATYFTVDVPDVVDFINDPPYKSKEATIREYADTITFEKMTIDSTQDPTLKDIYQGDTNMVMLKFKVYTDKSDAKWNRLRIERTGSGAPPYQTGTNADVSYIKVYYDADNDGKWTLRGDQLISSGTDTFRIPDADYGPAIDVPLTVEQTLTTAHKQYFVLLDIANNANSGNQVVLRIADPAWFGISNPNRMSGSNIPYQTSPVLIKPLNFVVKAENIAPTVALQRQKNVPILKLTVKSATNEIVLIGFYLKQMGTYQTKIKLGSGDGDVTRVAVYLDIDNDVTFSTSTDKMVGEVSAGTGDYADGFARVHISSTVVTTLGKTFFIVGDIGETDKSEGNNSTEGHLVGFDIEKTSWFVRTPDSAVAKFVDTTDREISIISSGKIVIQHFSTPVIEYIDANPDTSLIETDAWTSSINELTAIIKMALPPSDVNVLIKDIQYVIDQSTTPADRWNRLPVKYESGKATKVRVLTALEGGKKYYLHIRGVSEIVETGATKSGPWLYVTYKVEITPPSKPGKPTSVPEEKGVPAEESFVVRWAAALDPTPEEEKAGHLGSGVTRYEVQERVDNDPNWRTIDVVNTVQIIVGDDSAKDGSGYNIPDSRRKPGHFFYYRVRAQNLAGMWSEWSDTSNPTNTGLPREAVSNVIAYPALSNPSARSPVNLTYVLNEEAEVTIKLYDLNQNLVREWNISPGSTGGSSGTNTIPWNGINDIGESVGSGGYICKIQTKTSKGVTTKTIKFLVVR